MRWAGQSLQGLLLKSSPRPRLMTPRLSGSGMVIWAELEIRGPIPEKRKTCIQTVGCWKGVGVRHTSVQVLASKWLGERRQSR